MEEPTKHTTQVAVIAHDKDLILTGGLAEKFPGPWTTHALDDYRIVLSPETASTGITQPDGMAGLPILLFTKFLIGLYHSKWSGLVTVDTGYGLKRLYFSKGELVFAGSNLIDDRLGEVIYREAQISLDELTSSAAEVTKSRKFGQVLLASGAFDQCQLWDALGRQVKQILRSIFMVDRVYFEMKEGLALAPNELVLGESTGDLLHLAASYGVVFRSFLNKLTEESTIQLGLAPGEMPPEFGPGTFMGDMLVLISQFPNVQQLLDASKLVDLYTVATVFHLSGLGLIKVLPEMDDISPRGAYFSQVRAKVDAYSFVLGSVRKAFKDAGRELPVAGLKKFIENRNPYGWPMLSVDEHGELSRESMFGLYRQIYDHHERFQVIERDLEAMIQFLIQVTGDSLNFSLAMQIRQEYRSVST
jgi:hypothetical protein